MSEGPVHLAQRRVDKANDNRLWTPQEMLRALAAAIDRGEVKGDKAVALVWMGEKPGAPIEELEKRQISAWYANASVDDRASVGGYLIVRAWES